MSKLPYRPLPAYGEGLQGYLFRLAEGNGYGSIDFLLGKEKISIRRLIDWLGLYTTQPLQQLFPQLRSSSLAHIQPWSLHNSRYCPQCLELYPSWKMEWECKYFTVCPKHGTRLVEVCGECGKRFTWKRARLLTCDCGASLVKATADKADEDEIRLAAIIYAKFLPDPPSRILMGHLSLEEICQMIHVFGTYALADEVKVSQKIPKLANIEVASKLTKATAKIITNWPVNFHLLLDRLRKINAAPDSNKLLSKEYGFFYSYVFGSRMNSRKFDFIREAFENHIANNWLVPLTRRNKRISPNGLSSGVWLPLNQAANQLGTTRPHLDAMYEAGMINVHVRRLESGRRMMCIDRAFLPGIQEVLDDMVDLTKAASILNIKKTRMSQLLKSHVVHAYTELRKTKGVWGISLKSLNAILSIGESLPIPESIPSTTIGMDHVLQFWLTQAFLFPALIQAVKTREIMPVAISPDQPGIPGWAFDHDRLKTWCGEQTQQARNGAMTIPQVAVELGIKQEAAYHFVRKGILRAVRMDTAANANLITQAEIQRFRTTYVLSRDLAKTVGTSATHAMKLLATRGIKPVCGKNIDGCAQYLFQRNI